MHPRLSLVAEEADGPALDLRKVAKTYRDSWGRKVTALRDVSFGVSRGEIFGLLGPNGAGKSTTFKIVLGLLKGSGGSGSLLGHPLGSLEARERIGYLPENPYFYDYLTAPELLNTCARLTGMPSAGRREMIGKTLDLVGLEVGDRRRLRKYSKGMLQRLGLAQALLHDPDLLILDEPMSGLDPGGRALFRDIILGLKERGKTVVFASHVLPDVEALCDRVAILSGGIVRRTGTVGELLAPAAAGFEIEVSGLPDPLIKRWEDSGAARRGGDRIILCAADQDDVEGKIRQIFRAGGSLQAVYPRRASLESVFLSEVASEERSPSHKSQGAA